MPGIADRLPDLVDGKTPSQLVDPKKGRDESELADEVDEAAAPSDRPEHLLARRRGAHASPLIPRTGPPPARGRRAAIMIARLPRRGPPVTITAVCITVPVVCPAPAAGG